MLFSISNRTISTLCTLGSDASAGQYLIVQPSIGERHRCMEARKRTNGLQILSVPSFILRRRIGNAHVVFRTLCSIFLAFRIRSNVYHLTALPYYFFSPLRSEENILESHCALSSEYRTYMLPCFLFRFSFKLPVTVLLFYHSSV